VHGEVTVETSLETILKPFVLVLLEIGIWIDWRRDLLWWPGDVGDVSLVDVWLEDFEGEVGGLVVVNEEMFDTDE
jgi:hypothetical protein